MITFTVTFHGPFRVGTGVPAEGWDDRVDRDNPLPSTSLKGVMRASATETLAIDKHLVSAVFGRPAGTGDPTHRTTNGAWAWSDATFATVPIIRPVSRIRVDDRGRTVRGALMLGDHVWAESATFTVHQLVDLDKDTTHKHRMVLAAAARATTSLGALRRRGEGWVTITDDLTWDEATVMDLMGVTACS